jgi:hypothetical protein
MRGIPGFIFRLNGLSTRMGLTGRKENGRMDRLKWMLPAGLVLLFANGLFVEKVRALDATRVRLLPGSPFYNRQQLHRRGCVADIDCDKLGFHYRALPAALRIEKAKDNPAMVSVFIG